MLVEHYPFTIVSPDRHRVGSPSFRMLTATTFSAATFWQADPLGVRRGFESRLRRFILFYIPCSPSWFKASDFDSDIRWFESIIPSQTKAHCG